MKSEIPKGTRRQKQKEETRRIILESARSLFSEVGFKKATIREIARQAEVGFGTVFSHFPDKSSLLIAALLDDLAKTQEDAMKTFPLDGSVCEKFLYLSKQFYLYYWKNIDLSRTLIKEMWFVKGKWGESLRKHMNRYLAFIAEIIDVGKHKGEIKGDIDSGIVAASFFSNYYSVLLLGLDAETFKPDDLILILQMMVEQTMEGVAIKQE
jgi:AcrR family transcriptional regulator